MARAVRRRRPAVRRGEAPGRGLGGLAQPRRVAGGEPARRAGATTSCRARARGVQPGLVAQPQQVLHGHDRQARAARTSAMRTTSRCGGSPAMPAARGGRRGLPSRGLGWPSPHQPRRRVVVVGAASRRPRGARGSRAVGVARAARRRRTGARACRAARAAPSARGPAAVMTPRSSATSDSAPSSRPGGLDDLGARARAASVPVARRAGAARHRPPGHEGPEVVDPQASRTARGSGAGARSTSGTPRRAWPASRRWGCPRAGRRP